MLAPFHGAALRRDLKVMLALLMLAFWIPVAYGNSGAEPFAANVSTPLPWSGTLAPQIHATNSDIYYSHPLHLGKERTCFSVVLLRDEVSWKWMRCPGRNCKA